MKGIDDAARRDGRTDRKDDELGLTPREHDDLSALPAMPGHVEQIRGLPEKNLSLDM